MMIKPTIYNMIIFSLMLLVNVIDEIWIGFKLSIWAFGLWIAITSIQNHPTQGWGFMLFAFSAISLAITNLLWFAGHQVWALGYILNYLWGVDRIWLFLTMTLSLLISDWLTK